MCMLLPLSVVELMGIRFGTPISLLVKRFSAARVLPIMMVGFVSYSSVPSCFIHKSGCQGSMLPISLSRKI